jgi:hypothetical protein
MGATTEGRKGDAVRRKVSATLTQLIGGSRVGVGGSRVDWRASTTAKVTRLTPDLSAGVAGALARAYSPVTAHCLAWPLTTSGGLAGQAPVRCTTSRTACLCKGGGGVSRNCPVRLVGTARSLQEKPNLRMAYITGLIYGDIPYCVSDWPFGDARRYFRNWAIT